MITETRGKNVISLHSTGNMYTRDSYILHLCTFPQWLQKHHKHLFESYVLVSSSSYSRLSQTRWLINNRNLFFTVLESEKSKLKKQSDLVSGENLLPNSQKSIISLWPQKAERIRELSRGSFTRPLIPFMKALSSWSNHSPQAPSPYHQNGD